MISLGQKLKNFLKDDEGATAITVALCLIPILGLIGIAIDGGRAVYFQSELSYATDSAALAAGRASVGYEKEEALKYFNVNLTSGYMNAQVEDPIIDISPDGQRIKVSTQARVPTYFAQLFGYDFFKVDAVAEVQKGSGDALELAIILDTSNTTPDADTRLRDVQEGVLRFLDDLYGPTPDQVSNLWVSIIPYSASINIGPQNTDWLREYDAKQYPNGWRGCIEARDAFFSPVYGEEEVTPPTDDVNSRWRPYFYPSTLKMYVAQAIYPTFSAPSLWAFLQDGFIPSVMAVSTNNNLGKCISNCAANAPKDEKEKCKDECKKKCEKSCDTLKGSEKSKCKNQCEDDDDDDDDDDNPPPPPPPGVTYLAGDNDWDPSNPSSINDDLSSGMEGKGPNLGCPPPIQPLNPSKFVAQETLRGLVPVSRGGAFPNLGVIWGWRTLDPSWRGLWRESPTELPLSYGIKGTRKAAIFIILGDSVWLDYPKGCPGIPCSAKYPGADYTGYKRPTDKKLGSSNIEDAPALINGKALSVCKKMKAQGIEIYTLGVGDLNPETQSLLEGCATDSEHSHKVLNQEEMTITFQKISGIIRGNVRLIQ